MEEFQIRKAAIYSTDFLGSKKAHGSEFSYSRYYKILLY